MAQPTGSFEEWLKTRPACVQELAAEFPLGTAIELGDETFHLIGYTEDDFLIVSLVDPSEDYDAAYEARQRLCADHLRRAI